MKKKLRQLIYSIFKVFYKKYTPNNESIRWLVISFFFQKIIGINHFVPWPVHFTSHVEAHENIYSKTELVGEAIGSYIDGRNGIFLEENVWIGPNVSIISQDHNENDYTKYVDSKPIIIRKNSLLLANCVILPGVELGEHTIVAAGAVVTKSFLEGNITIGGVPAKIIKKLDNYNI